MTQAPPHASSHASPEGRVPTGVTPNGGAHAGVTQAGSAHAGSAHAGSAHAGSAHAGSASAGSAPAGSALAGSAQAGSAPGGSTPARSAHAGHAPARSAHAGASPAVASSEPLSADDVRGFRALADRLAAVIGTVVLGKPEVIRLMLTALLAEGHVLIEDVPGVGKTTLARAVAAVIDGAWRRIQFTPDLLPSDVTGVTVYHPNTQGPGAFQFHPGPVFAHVVIADEINRASPKTQSALLEVMGEGNVTIDGVRHAVPRPFLVVATQNPIEMDGTYRLPEAQLDRFLMKLSVGYPDETTEVDVLRGAAVGLNPDSIVSQTDTATIAAAIEIARRVYIADPLYAYAVRLAAATRAHDAVRVGASPRGTIALTRAASAYALLHGRGYVLPEDLKTLVPPVLAHRLILQPAAVLRGMTAAQVLRDVDASVPVPVPDAF